jgi:phage shock protein A
MLDQMVRDYSENIHEAEAAVATTIGNLRMAEEDHHRAINEATDWSRKAIAASHAADEFRAAGNLVDADKFDALAKVAIGRQMTAESTAKGPGTDPRSPERGRRQAQERPGPDARQAR